MKTCEHREYTAEDDRGVALGPACGKPARWANCDPVDMPACDEHVCRCRRALRTTALEVPVAQELASAAGDARRRAQLPEQGNESPEDVPGNGGTGHFEGSRLLGSYFDADQWAAFAKELRVECQVSDSALIRVALRRTADAADRVAARIRGEKPKEPR